MFIVKYIVSHKIKFLIHGFEYSKINIISNEIFIIDIVHFQFS